jgi:hypothetical protein
MRMPASLVGGEVRDMSQSSAIVALVTAPVVLLSLILATEPTYRYALALLWAWLFFAAMIRYAGARAASPHANRWIPIRFSGELGRFRLRPRGDGRRVEIQVDGEIVAEAIATDDGDELLVDPWAVADSELEEFGTAIGQAIEMAAAADEDRPAERHVAGPASWRKPES